MPADLLSLHFDTGPRDGKVRRNAADDLLSISLASRDHATLSVLDFEGTGVFTQKFSHNPKLKSSQRQVILISASGTFPGINAPDSGDNGLGTLTVTLSEAKIVDLAPYGEVAPPNSTNISSPGGATFTVIGPAPQPGATSGSVSIFNVPYTPVQYTPITIDAVSITGSRSITFTEGSSYYGGTAVDIVTSGTGAVRVVSTESPSITNTSAIGGSGSLGGSLSSSTGTLTTSNGVLAPGATTSLFPLGNATISNGTVTLPSSGASLADFTILPFTAPLGTSGSYTLSDLTVAAGNFALIGNSSGIIMEAVTINLVDLNAPEGSVVSFNSRDAGLSNGLAIVPSFTNPAVGSVNFLGGVSYGGLPLETGSNFITTPRGNLTIGDVPSPLPLPQLP